MLIYILIIIVLFILSYNRRVSNTERLMYVLLSVFLCFGYMCGSDWRTYESDFYSNFGTRTVEPGYMLLSNWVNDKGIDFWYFHTTVKVFCWYSFVHIFKRMNNNRSLGFPLMLFMASFGFYLFIDCPFRNLISISIFLFFLPLLEKKSYLLYTIGVLLASSFHLSALFFLLLPLINVNKLSNKALIIIYFGVFCVMLFGWDRIFINKVLSFFPFLHSRLLFYEGTALTQGSVFSVGLILRLICLFGMLYFREGLYRDNKSMLFNLCYIYLLLSLVSYSIPIMFRIPFFLSPIFVLMIFEIVSRLEFKTQQMAKLFYLLVAITITIKTTSSVYYVPYTNIITYWLKGDMPSFSERDVYNFINSPFRKK